MAVKCPECGSTKTWKAGFVPSRKGKKDRMRCTNCGRTFYPGAAKKRASRKPKAPKASS